MKKVSLIILIVFVCIFFSCEKGIPVLEQNKISVTEEQDNSLVSEYYALLFEGKPVEESFLDNVRFYTINGDLISQDSAVRSLNNPAIANIRSSDPLLICFDVPQQAKFVEDYCCDVELTTAGNVSQNETWFVQMNINEHK